MNRMPRLRCSNCGSEKTELQAAPPNAPFLPGKMLQLLRQLLPGPPSLSGGQYVLVCRECGHTALIQVR